MKAKLEDMLNEKGFLVTKASGNSMLLLIRPNCDTVILKKLGQDTILGIYDVVLYKRKNEIYVLHRILGKNQAGYILCGDSQTQKEYGIQREQILAVLEGLYRGKWYIDCHKLFYRFYIKLWCGKSGMFFRKTCIKLYLLIRKFKVKN